jgi:hypothetical protein
MLSEPILIPYDVKNSFKLSISDPLLDYIIFYGNEALNVSNVS